MVAENWNQTSWQLKPTKHQPIYKTTAEQKTKILSNLNNSEHLTSLSSVQNLKTKLKNVFEKKAILIIGGDCAEKFSDCNPKIISQTLSTLHQIEEYLKKRLNLPVVLIGRIAGQYFKPRSSPYEALKNGEMVSSYKGDGINSLKVNERDHNFSRLLKVHETSKKTLEYIRKFEGELLNAEEGCKRFFTCHEGLLLPYEAAQTYKEENLFFNSSAEFLWIGDRTRQIDGGHIEYFRGITNPIGLKIGPNFDCEEIVKICKILNPSNLKGKLVLITRLSKSVKNLLPALIKSIKSENLNVIWQCDPMHGNSVKRNGFKTRILDDIVREITETFAVHKSEGSFLSGLHLEITGQKVTECLGGDPEILEEDLGRNYLTACDPRLNPQQGLQVVKAFADLFSE